MVFQYHFIDAPMESTGMHREKSIKKTCEWKDEENKWKIKKIWKEITKNLKVDLKEI